MPSQSIMTANPSGLRTDAVQIPIGRRARPRSSTTAGSTLPPILKFDSSGNLLKSFGAGMFIFPHKIYMDPDGNVWVADQRSANERELTKFPAEKAKGHIVIKFSPDGKVLLTLGKPGVAGNPPDALTQPTGIVMAPNGDVFISEGHNQNPQAPPETVAHLQIHKGRQVYKVLWQIGIGTGRIPGTSRSCNGRAGTALCC
jgi:hypothetical protein